MHRLKMFVLFVVAAAAAGLGVPSAASSYPVDDGSSCNEYDPDRGIYYYCTPDYSSLYTPEGEDPAWYTGASGGGYDPYAGGGGAALRDNLPGDGGGSIPPPAPYDSSKNYCSAPWFAWNPYEGSWNFGCYRHDVCYGSQLGRKYCDVRFWKDMANVCRNNYDWYDPRRYDCLADARELYYAVRQFGDSHYNPRTSSSEP
jgi:hypothetical protein